MLTALLAAGAAGLLAWRPLPARLAEVVGPLRHDPAAATGASPPVRAPLLAFALAALSAVLLLGGVLGLLVGAGLLLGGPRLVSGLEPTELRRQREQLERDLPLALDLLSACLAGGAPLERAVRAVADAVPGPCGDRLRRVEAALVVGSPPAEAWSVLSQGEDPARPVAAPAVRALVRAGEGGAPVAATVARLAADVRAQARARSERRARQAGVSAVAPLGLCFLPAFVLLGVAPVVLGLVGPLLSSLG